MTENDNEDTAQTIISPEPALATLPKRRTFLAWLTGITAGLASFALGLPLVSYLLRLRKRDAPWISVGAIADFPPGETRTVLFDNPLGTPWDGVTAHTGVFVRYEGQSKRSVDQFLVLAVNCAHLGCPVSWFPQSGLFMCPCHGGVYTSDGERASGPPPRGLYHCAWRVRKGQLEIRAPHFPTLQDTLQSPV